MVEFTQKVTKRLMVVVAHAYLREQIQALLEGEPSLEVVATIESGVQALSEARRLQPDGIIVDQALPDSNGLAISHMLSNALPNSRIILLVTWPDYRKPALESGATETVVKSELASRLIETIKRTCAQPIQDSAS